MDAWHRMSAGDLGRAIGRGEIDPVALTAYFLDRVRQDPDSPRIYARMTEDRAIAEAEAASLRARAGQRRGLLDGVPISWKDLFDTAGTATEAGSRLLAGRVPDRDARVLSTATAGGLVCLGKTHMTELAFSGLGLNPVTATPPNAFDPARAPGGSSSGAAVSVARGLAAAAVGSDTGGSVRVPAAWNGLVGLKTTHGRLPLDGVVPLVENFDTVGPITRTVEDAALLLAALEGRKPPDLEGATLRGVRLLVLDSVALDDCRPEPLAAFENAVARLKEAGARIEHVVAPEVDEALALSLPLFTAEAYAIWAERIEAQPDMMFAPIRDRFRAGAKVMAGEYVNAWRSLRNLRIVWNDRLAGCDAVLMPTTAILPPLSERLQADATYFAAENLLALRNTRIVNLMGGAAITLPSGEPMCGITLTGGPGSDGRLLRLASAAEVALR